MRYVVIPGLIILIIWWGYESVKDFIRVYDSSANAEELEGYTVGFVCISLMLLILGFIWLCAKYW